MRKILIGNHGVLSYVSLVAGSAIALTLSMPWVSRLSELMAYPWRPFPLPFFLTYGFLSAIVALYRSADAVPMGRVRISILTTALARVLFAQALVLPLVSYSLALFPASGIAALLAAAYVTAACLGLAAATVVFEVYAIRRGWHSLPILTAGFLALLAAPTVFFAVPGPARLLSLISPAVALTSLVTETPSAAHLALAFAVPAILGVGSAVWILALTKGGPRDDEA